MTVQQATLNFDAPRATDAAKDKALDRVAAANAVWIADAVDAIRETARKLTSPARPTFGNAIVAESRGATSAAPTTPTAFVSVPPTPMSTGWIWRNTRASLLPTPLGDDWKGGTTSLRKGKPRTEQFRHWCKVVHGLTYPIPEHSEAVMGFPIGWTDSRPLETHRFREWWRWHGPLCPPDSGRKDAT